MVKRYDFELDHHMYEARPYIREDENPHGEWVKHSDYAALAERCERLEAALLHCENMLIRYEINRVDGEEIADVALGKIRHALGRLT